MSRSNPVVKILTIALFGILIGGFVIIKSGCLSSKDKETDKESPERMMPGSKSLGGDGIPVFTPDTSEPEMIIPSSKSGPPVEPREIEFFPGSKSAPPVDGEEMKILLDSILKSPDTNTIKTIPKDVIIPSTKSAPIFEPQAPEKDGE